MANWFDFVKSDSENFAKIIQAGKSCPSWNVMDSAGLIRRHSNAAGPQVFARNPDSAAEPGMESPQRGGRRPDESSLRVLKFSTDINNTVYPHVDSSCVRQFHSKQLIFK